MSLFQELAPDLMNYSNRKEPVRSEWREKLEADTKAFLKSGGSVQCLSPFESNFNDLIEKKKDWKQGHFQVFKHRRPAQ